MQRISTTSSSFYKTPYSNEREAKESRKNFSKLRKNVLPIASIQEQIINYIKIINDNVGFDSKRGKLQQFLPFFPSVKLCPFYAIVTFVAKRTIISQ